MWFGQGTETYGNGMLFLIQKQCDKLSQIFLEYWTQTNWFSAAFLPQIFFLA
jgi:hypothetical protein